MSRQQSRFKPLKFLFMLDEEEMDLFSNLVGCELASIEDIEDDDSDLSKEDQIKLRFFFAHRLEVLNRLANKIDNLEGHNNV